MSALQGRVGTKIKAFLTILHKGGYNVAGIEQHAENAMRRGQPAASAYEAAVGSFLRGTPGIKLALERVAKLIDHSDPATVAKYEQAVSDYIATRDETAIDALEPMMRADLTAMAVRSGELSVEDAGAGRVDWASMGMPGLALSAAHSADTPPLASAPQKFAFGAPAAFPGQITGGRTDPSHASASQPSLTNSPTGYRTLAVQAKWNATPTPTYSKPSPYDGMSPAQIKDAAAAQAAQPRGWIDRPAED